MTDKVNPVLSVDFQKYYSTTSDGIEQIIRVCIDADAIKTGLIKELGASKFGLLMVIVAHMDGEGKCFPSQRKLSELTGQSPTTVNKHINELLEVTYNGQRILKREFVGGTRKKSIYTIHNGGHTSTDEVIEVKPVTDTLNEPTVKALNSRDVALLFGDIYEQTFGQGYTFSYARELAMIKNKLIGTYDDETLKEVLAIAITQYQARWANRNYPLPTISMLCSWLANQAFAVYKQGSDDTKAVEQKIETGLIQDDTDRAMSLFD